MAVITAKTALVRKFELVHESPGQFIGLVDTSVRAAAVGPVMPRRDVTDRRVATAVRLGGTLKLGLGVSLLPAPNRV